MGIAAYNRGTRDLRAQIDAECRQRRNTLMARAAIWAWAIEQGAVLTWRTDRGTVLTLGPYQTATARPSGYAVIEHTGKRRMWVERLAWHAALRLVSMAGRARPAVSEYEYATEEARR